jgi:MOSC domain-containing protein YiiM
VSPNPDPAPARIEVATVNVGAPSLLAAVRGERVWSGIRKQPVAPAAVLWLSSVNLAGDGQADLSVHGGVDKAVYAYPSEHLPAWAEELDDDFGPAPFGENLSTVGVLEADVRIGDVWSWGSAWLQVCQPRWPCFKLALHRRRADIQARLRETGRTGWYLRVLAVGEVPAAGPVVVVAPDDAGVTVRDAHLAMADTDLASRARVEAVAAHPALAAQWRAPLLERLERLGR